MTTVSAATPRPLFGSAALVRGAMAGSIRKGEPLPSTSLRNRTQEPSVPPPTVAPKREDPTR